MIRLFFSILLVLPLSAATLSRDTAVADVLKALGEPSPAHAVDGADLARRVQRGRQLVAQGRSLDPDGKPGKEQSKYFRCTDCHALEREAPDPRSADPEARLAYLMEKQLPLLQGTSFYGTVNRTSWYNEGYQEKYGKLVTKAHTDLRESVQVCSKTCSRGRSLEDWELDSILAFLWSLQYRIRDLAISDADFATLKKAYAAGKPNPQAVALLKSYYRQAAPASFGEKPDDQNAGYGLTGRAKQGQAIYRQGCLHCHGSRANAPEQDSYGDDAGSRGELMDDIDSKYSIYRLIRSGKHTFRGAYMPEYPLERMSNQMVEDLRAYLEGGPEAVGEEEEPAVVAAVAVAAAIKPNTNTNTVGRVSNPAPVVDVVAVGDGLETHPTKAPTLSGSLTDQAIQILEARCASCHAATGGNKRASKKWPGMDRLELLTGKYVAANTATEEQELWYILTDPDDPMPPENADTGTLTKAELNVLKRWIADGAPRQEQAEVVHIDNQTVLQTVMNDLLKLDRHRRRTARYFTLTNLHNVARDIPQMDTYRVGLAKTLNSLSQRRDLVIPVAIDPQQTIYRIYLDDLDWPESHWEELLSIYPYGLLDDEDRIGDVVYGLTSSRMPILRADWFVFAATQPPLYGKLLGHGPRLQHLDEQLDLDRDENIRRHRVARAGFVSSGVSANNRLIERHETRYGSYWISYDFKNNDGRGDLLSNPLGPAGLLHSTKAFDHAGGEVIYSLPNGLQGYYLAEADGRELYVGPADIVYDDSNPRGGVIINGISCISCHAQGIRRGTDDIRQHVLANRSHFLASERRVVEDIYPESAVMDRLLTQDASQFRAAMTSLISGLFAGDSARSERALEAAGLVPGKSAVSVEPVRALFDRFLEPLDLESAASSLGFTAAQLKADAAGAPTLHSIIGRLERTGVARDKYLAVFSHLAGDLGLEIRAHHTAEFPIFNHSLRPTTGVPLLDTANSSSAFRVQLDTEDGRRRYREGEEFRLKVRANRDCFITLITVDPSGQMVQLVPSQAIPVERIPANQTVLLPSEFNLIVDPPHGRSLMRVIATTRPLQVAAHRSVVAQANEPVRTLGTIPDYTGTRDIRVNIRPRPTGNRVIRVSDRPRPAAVAPPVLENTLSQFSAEEWTTADLVLETHQ